MNGVFSFIVSILKLPYTVIPELLLKSILSELIDNFEKLGIIFI